MSNKPLAYRLGIYISAAVLFVYAIFIVWAYNYNYLLSKENAVNKALMLNASILQPVREKIISTQEVASNIVTQIPFYHEHGEIDNFFKGVLKKYPYITSIQIHIDPHGSDLPPLDYFSYPNDTAKSDSRNRFDFSGLNQVPASAGSNSEPLKPYWTEPYRCTACQQIVSVYYLPFKYTAPDDPHPLTGFVACQLSLDFLKGIIEQREIGKKAFAFLISAKGIYLTHPMEELIMERSIFHLPSDVFQGDSAFIAENFLTGRSPVTVYPTPLNNVRSWAYPSKISENGWVLTFVIPYSELYRDLNILIWKMIAVSLLVAGLIFYLVFAISKRVTRPLSRISKELHSFSIGKLEQDGGEDDETVSLNHSLERLRTSYEKMKQEEEEALKRRKKYRNDLMLASEIQQSIIPPSGNHILQNGGIRIHVIYKPLNIVSGDLYDFFMIDEHRLLVALGDVSGEGIPAALFMGVADTFIKTHAHAGSARDIVSEVNAMLCKNNDNQFFLTLFLGIIDLQKETLNYCNAGHSPSFLLSHNGNVKELGDPHGLPLGLYHDRIYKDNLVHMDKRDALILYTDGIIEQNNESGEQFGTDSFYRLFEKIRGKTPEEISGAIIKAVNDFAGATHQSDDLSLLVISHE